MHPEPKWFTRLYMFINLSKKSLVWLGVAVFICGSFLVSRSGLETGIVLLDSGVSDENLLSALDYTSWASNESPDNEFLICLEEQEFRVCGTISKAVLRSFYPLQREPSLYTGIELTYQFSLGNSSGQSSHFGYSYNSDLPNVYSYLIDPYHEQISHLNDQLNEMGASNIVGEYTEEEVTHVYQYLGQNEETNFDILRMLLCADFDYYFRTSLDGERILQTRHASTSRLMRSIMECKRLELR